MGNVRLEIMPGLSRYFTAERVGRVVLEREVNEGTTVRDLLEEVTSQNREFEESLFNASTGNLAVHVSLILNGKFLELSGGLEATLKPGDTIRLMLAFTGG
jgi:molybdopterin converting factor small subunit